MCCLLVGIWSFQSTRPRGRTRLELECKKPFSIGVSIHASSREDATIRRNLLLMDWCFNPRVLAGGRDQIGGKIMGNFEFQSTRPRGRTRLPGLINRLIKKVSIHASSREDATSRFPLIRARRCFNPRVLAGGRDYTSISYKVKHKFQSTRPRGRTRLGHPEILGRLGGFNPRVLAGGRD